MSRRAACLLSLTLFVSLSLNADSAGSSAAQQGDDPAIEVMVLGTYHMAGSNADVVNIEVDSVFTEHRQRELEELAIALATFEPTVVVTERVTDAPDYLDPKLDEFSETLLGEVANERVQVALRLANRAGVTRVYGLDEQPEGDEPDYFPFGTLMAHAESVGRAEELQAMISQVQSMAEELMASTANEPVAARLLEMNTGPMSSPDFYYALSEFDEGEAQPAAELQGYWFMRNAKIWSKLMDVTKPGDRVVVVYGAGHKFWLEHMARRTPGFRSVDPAPFLELALGR